MRKSIVGIVVLAMFLFAGTVATADVYNFDLSVGNSDIAGYAPPYVAVSINAVSNTTAIVTATAYSGYLFGGSGAFGLNTNGPVTYSDISWSGVNPSTSFSLTTGGGNLDGFGKFNFVLDAFDGYPSAVAGLQFTLNGSGWDDAMDVLTPNPIGRIAASHVFVMGPDSALATGYASNGGSTSVPEPLSLLLLGGGLFGVALGKRKG